MVQFDPCKIFRASCQLAYMLSINMEMCMECLRNILNNDGFSVTGSYLNVNLLHSNIPVQAKQVTHDMEQFENIFYRI